ncbi:MAG TPA: histidine phosphatase family protein [Microlunatus sp.]|nr:histidine phosphatase family protein [Microlunatus sp.]
MVTDLYLIRHGESVANVEPIIAGRHGDAGLTDRGRRQAELLERRLSEQPIPTDVLYASTLPRAVQTAEYVSRALGLPATPEDTIRELDPGIADGLSVAEWRDRFPGLDPGPLAAPFQAFAPEGESWAAFQARVGAALASIIARHPDETVVAVTHGGVIESSLLLAFGVGATAHPVEFDLANTGITHWRHRGAAGTQSAWTLVAFNDAGHLVGDVSGEPPRQAVPTPVED